VDREEQRGLGGKVPGVVGVTDFLLELRSEEVPARMQAGARRNLEKLFRQQMTDAGVALGDITVWSTPRRLALIARGLPDATAAVSEEVKGPKTSAPEQALEGFLRKTGLSRDQLTERDGVYFAVSEKPGRATLDVLAEAIPAIIRAFPWPKSQRWGAASISTESQRWVRPLSGIVAIFGEALVLCEAAGVASSYATRGHRFHHPGEITIGSAADYADKLRACHVVVDHSEREAVIRERAKAVAAEAGLVLVEDEGLVVENAGLTEYPVPLLGRFDETYLEVPPEVIQLTARTNQKYFVCETAGKLANAFVCTANIEASDHGAGIVAGNRKVLAARLSDARFFWEQDRKKTLAEHAEGLARITFHEKLGTVHDKVERVARLARVLVEHGDVLASPKAQSSEAQREGLNRAELANFAEQAARLCKADLVTAMVGEFPELQGLMGGYYARAEGLPDAVSQAIRDHYKPVGQGDDVPTAPVTVAVSLADKLDTLLGFFTNNFYPTGSRDPYGLRRAALGIMRLVQENKIRIDLDDLFSDIIGNFFLVIPDPSRPEPDQIDIAELSRDPNVKIEYSPGRTNVFRNDIRIITLAGHIDSLEDWDDRIASVWDGWEKLLDFITERMRVGLVESGYRHDHVTAAMLVRPPFKPLGLANYEFDFVRLLARVHALQAFIGTEDGANLLAGYKRAANILKKEDWTADAPRIPHDGEEDPFAMVDDPDVAAAVRARAEMRNALSYTSEPAENALIDALDMAGPQAATAVAAEDFAGAMAALARLRAPIDAFFDQVTVNDPDQDKRQARLSLLARFREAVHGVADFSKIEG
jgi:glycyl-tRNA synthetase beta chain